jgi:small subunit ribosomal protein S9
MAAVKAKTVEQHVGTGRRKTSVARIRMVPGSGKITVNQHDIGKYFRLVGDCEAVLAPLRAVNVEKSVDVAVSVNGGGITGQAGAASLGIARALVRYNPDFEAVLRDKKFLTRDSRKKERKKYGRRGARRSFQFSKR